MKFSMKIPMKIRQAIGHDFLLQGKYLNNIFLFRSLALIILFIAASLAHKITLEPIFSHYKAYLSALSQLEKNANSYRRQLMDSTRLDINNVVGTNLYLEAPSITQGAALVQAKTNELASSYNVSINSTRILPAQQVGPFERIRLNIIFSGNIKSIFSFVYDLEATQSVFFPGDMSLKRTSDASFVSQEDIIPMQMNLIIDAYLLVKKTS